MCQSGALLSIIHTVVESPFDSKEIKPVNPKGYQLWILVGRTDAEAEAPVLWPPDAKSQLIGKDPDARKDWKQEEKGMTEDKIFGWHHRVNGHEFEQTLGDDEGQGSLACCSPQGHRVKHNWVTEQQQWQLLICGTKKKKMMQITLQMKQK